MYPDIRFRGINTRALSGGLTELVAECILNLECDKVQASEWTLDCRDIDTDCQGRFKPIGPGQSVCGLVNIFLPPLGL